jgi:hypothetical protein
MAEIPAAAQDVADRWRPLTDIEFNAADWLIGDAWVLLKHLVSTLEARMDAEPAELDPALVRIVLVDMVKRVLANPDLLRQETLQDYSATHSALSGLLTVTEAELNLLAPADVGAGNAFTIRTVHQVPAGTPAVNPALWEWRP